MPRKSGTGCITCRIRRVKCDEAKPSCQRCLSSKRRCDGYLPEDSTVTRRQLAEAARQLSVVGPISQALSQYPRHRSHSPTPTSMSLFDVFRNLTAPSTASFIPSRFWTRELLQLAHSEPAVWHATLALGALHQRHELFWQGQGHGHQNSQGLMDQAHQSYTRAVSYAQDLKDPTRLLSLSLALVSITNMMGRWSESQVHITAGHRLLKQAGTGEATMSAAEILTRLDLQAMTFSDSSAPYSYDNTPRSVYIDTLMRQVGQLESYAQAGTALFGLMRRFMLLGETLVADDGEQGEEAIIQNLIQDIASWEYKMADFERNRDPQNAIGAISIRLYHTLLRMCITAGGYGPEARWDRLLGYFERIITLAELLWSNTPNTHVQSPLSLEPGLIVPVFMTCQRCRHPWLRRRCIAFLHKIKRQEGMWSSDGAAVVAEKIMEVEGQVYYTSDLSRENSPSPMQIEEMSWEEWATGDGQLPAKTSWAGIPRVPEKGRVRDTLVMVEAEQKRVHLSLIMSPGEDLLGTLGEVREETVTF